MMHTPDAKDIVLVAGERGVSSAEYFENIRRDVENAKRFQIQSDIDVFEQNIGVDRVANRVTRYSPGSDKWELALALQDLEIEAMPVLMLAELVADPHLADREFLWM